MIIACANRDPTRIVLWSENNRGGGEAFVVVDNSVERTVRRSPSIAEGMVDFDLVEVDAPGFPRRADSGSLITRPDVTTFNGLPNAPEWAGTLIAWGRKAFASKKTRERSDRARERPRTAPCAVIGDMRIERWTPAIARRSAHSLEKIVEIVSSAVAKCFNAWNWKPMGLTLNFHKPGRSMGLAYNPGQGDRRISLSTDLISAYDATSVLRVVLHELCHHAREELHQRDPHEASSDDQGDGGHDAIFCRMLGEVDSVVRDNPTSCRFFNDDADPQAVAVSRQKRGAVYVAAAGWLEFAVSQDFVPRYRWMPAKSWPHKWAAEWDVATLESLESFLSRFAPSDRGNIFVEWSFRRDGSQKKTGFITSFVRDAAPRYSVGHML